jgi:anti-sigma-K factor RskA
MDSRQTIDSGILEMYVLGALPAGEAAEITRLSKIHPEILAEIEAIEAALIQYGETNAQAPDARVLEGALVQIAAEGASVSTAPAAPPAEAKVVPFRFGLVHGWAVAASLAFLLSLGFLFNQKQAIDQSKAQQEALASQVQEYADKLAVLNDPRQKVVSLTNSQAPAQGLLTVYFDSTSGKIHLMVHNLGPAPQGMQYQLWAIKGGQPLNAGVFDPVKGIHSLEVVPNEVQTFAITLEPTGGSPLPTSQPIMAAPVQI